MASHRMSDADRPRRAVPAWVTAPPEDVVVPVGSAPEPGLEARITSPASVAQTEAVGSATSAETVAGTTTLLEDVVVPDYPPQEEHLPPAPTSPTVHTVPFDQAPVVTPAPMSPIDAAPPVVPAAAVPASPVVPAVPSVGQPRFSVPGLEHVVVEGADTGRDGVTVDGVDAAGTGKTCDATACSWAKRRGVR